MKKGEKYITRRVSKAGTVSYEVYIRAYDQIYRKSVCVKDFNNEKEALNVAKKIRNEKLVEMEQGYTVSNFKTVKEIYQKTFELLPVRQKTVTRHGHFYNKAIKPYENKTLDRITSADIQKSINDYAKDHTKRQTVGVLAIWRRIYKTAYMLNISIPDRTIPVKIPECKREEQRQKSISPQDLDIFLETLQKYNVKEPRSAYKAQCVYYAIQVMKYCGIRPAECLALTKKDIFLNADQTAGFITINKAQHSTIDSTLEIGRTKTEESNRAVPIPEDLAPIIKECLTWAKHELLFSDFYGNLQDINDISDYVRRVAKKAGVKFNLYMLRHQYSTDLFLSGVNPVVIRDLMGHKSATMSLDYAVSKEEDRRKALESRKFS